MKSLLPDQLHRPRQRDHGRVPPLALGRRQDRGGVGAWTDAANTFWATPGGWTLITVAQILAVIVCRC